MTRGKAPDGSFQRFEYDEAGRVKVIKTDSGTALETNTYGTSRQRLKKEGSGTRTYYAWGGSSVLAEYTETSSQTNLPWSKHYVYAGSRLLSTAAKNGSSEKLEYHHPDRLGTKMVSDPVAVTNQEQATLPFGTEITAETQATTNQKFTSYDRSGSTGLDYAVNRTYNSGQGRFTQVDPIGMGDSTLGSPQSMNLYGYVRNNPIDFVDPNGLNLSATRFICYTITVYGHYEDANGEYTGSGEFSSTRCTFFGGSGGSGGSGGYQNEFGGGGGSGGGGSSSGGEGNKQENDCERFARRVEGIANRHKKIRSFLDELARVFNGVRNSSTLEMLRNANRPPNRPERYNSTGFREQFFDDRQDNQARHFIGGLIAGQNAGITFGLLAMNNNEDSEADLAVNRISVPLGASLVAPRKSKTYTVKYLNTKFKVTIPGTRGFRGLGDMIRQWLCVSDEDESD